METVKSFNVDSKLDRSARCPALQISGNKEKGLIKVNGGGVIIIISDSSISSCKLEEGQLVIYTNEGRKFMFRSEQESGTSKLLLRLNRALESSNCDLKFEMPQNEDIGQVPRDLKNRKIEQKASFVAPIIAVSGLLLLVVYLVALTRATNETINKNYDREVAQDDSWSEKSIKEREAYYKSQQNEREEYWKKQKEKEVNSQQIAPAPQNKDTKIASIILAASCAGKMGLMPRSEIGSTLKKMLEDKGIDATEVYGNWDYYWGIAIEMDAVNKTYCLK